MKITSSMKTNEDELNYYNITWIFLKTSHLDSHTTNDAKQEMLSGVQTGNKMMMNIMYAALHMRAHT